MKTAYIILYWISGLMFLIAVLGSSLTKYLFDSISEKTLEVAGVNKSYFESFDDKIDEMIYKTKQVELEIEKVKKFFTSGKLDESKYQKEKSAMLEKSVYNPLVQMFNYIYRIGFVLVSFIALSFAVSFHIAYRIFDLRRRVKRLEELVLVKRY